MILCMILGTSTNSCLVPYTLQRFRAFTPEGKLFEGIRPKMYFKSDPEYIVSYVIRCCQL